MTKHYSKADIIELYKDDLEVMVHAQAINNGARSRVDEIIAFSEVAGYRKIAIDHCVSVTREAQKLESILSGKFETERVHSKAPSTTLIVKDEGNNNCPNKGLN